MKKVLIAFMLLLQHVSYGQTLFSDMDGFGNTINKCDVENECFTFDILCTGGVGSCSSTSLTDRWLRIGTPHYVSATTIGMVAAGSPDNVSGEDGSCEGIFTNFNFIPGKTYRINVGIKSMMAPFGVFPPHLAAIKLFSANELQETNGKVCCQEEYLWDFSANAYNAGTWHNNNSQWSSNINAVDLIGSIAPGSFWSGTTHNYSINYTVPTSGIIPTMFAMHTYLNHPLTIGTSPTRYIVDFEIDYVRIEECNFNSNFDYSFTTFNPLNVTFNPASHFVPKPYDWDFGDGIHSFVKTTLTHSYPSYGSYIASLLISDEDCSSRRFAKICLDSPTVENYIEGETGGLQGVNNNDPCNPHFQFQGSSVRAEDVNVTVLGGHTGPSAFKIVWGDGNISTSTGPVSFMHTYPSIPATYTITVEADGGRCRASLDVCIEEQVGEGGDGGPYGGGGDNGGGTGQGKSTQTNIAARNELMSINSIAPNPASTIIALNIDGKIATHAQIKVFDLTGKQVVVKESNINIGKNKIELDIANLANGMYLVEVKASNERILRTKFIKE